MDTDQISVGSVISLRSLSDAESIIELRGSKKNALAKKGSPYLSRKTKRPPQKTGREVWVNAVQNGAGMSNEISGMNSMKFTKGVNQISASLYLQDALGLPKKKTRPSSATARVGGTGPVYKDAETYYDEIQALKRTVSQLKNESSLLKGKQVRMEDEITAKTKKIEELLNPNTQCNDLRRVLTTKKTGSSEVVMSLRRKIYKLEEILRSKENEHRKMADDLKYTNIVELRLENEVYLDEIKRLKETLFNQQNSLLSEDAIHDALKNNSGKKTETLLKRLTEDNRGLVMQNKALQIDLMKLTRPPAANSDKDCEDMNRAELLNKISALEQKLKEEEKNHGFKDEKPEGKKKNNDGTLDERCIELNGPFPQQVRQLREQEQDLLVQIDKLQLSMSKLKEDRSHYRKMTDDYRQRLDELSKAHNQATTEASKFSETTPHMSRKNSSFKTPRKGDSSERDAKLEKERKIGALKEKQAARTIQRSWRSRQQSRKVKNKEVNENGMEDEDELENAIIDIQSALRGHKVRQKHVLTKRQKKNEVNNDDILLIQSTFRGHAVRSRFINKKKKLESCVTSERTKDYKTVSSHLNDDVQEDDSDEDDDVVVGSSVSLSQYRHNTQRPQSQINDSRMASQGKGSLNKGDSREEYDLRSTRRETHYRNSQYDQRKSERGERVTYDDRERYVRESNSTRKKAHDRNSQYDQRKSERGESVTYDDRERYVRENDSTRRETHDRNSQYDQRKSEMGERVTYDGRERYVRESDKIFKNEEGRKGSRNNYKHRESNRYHEEDELRKSQPSHQYDRSGDYDMREHRTDRNHDMREDRTDRNHDMREDRVDRNHDIREDRVDRNHDIMREDRRRLGRDDRFSEEKYEDRHRQDDRAPRNGSDSRREMNDERPTRHRDMERRMPSKDKYDDDMSVNQLKSSSRPWAHSPQHSSEDDDVLVCTPSPRRKNIVKQIDLSGRSQKNQDAAKKVLANKWAKSGSSYHQEKPAKNKPSTNQRFSIDDELF